MIPIELRIRGFLSYREETVLDFSPFRVACISGHNGAGKSALLDAMTWALFGKARLSDENVIHMQEDVAQVTFTFAYEGNIYRIMRTNPRGKTTQLEFQIQQADGSWKPLSERTLSRTNARIQQLLGLDYKTFVAAAFFLQGEADSFTRMRPAERKAVLSDVLGLEQWETYRQRTRQRIQRLERRLEDIKRQILEKEEELAEGPARKEALQRLERELQEVQETRKESQAALESMQQTLAGLEEQRKLVTALESHLKALRTDLASLQERLAQRREEQQSYQDILQRADEIQALHEGWQQARTELEHWEALAVQFHQQQMLRQQPLMEIQREQVRLEQELRTLQEQQRQYENTVQQLSALEGKLQTARQNLQEVETALSQRKALQEELEDITGEHSRIKAENTRYKQEMDALKERIETLRTESGSTCPTCGQPLTDEHRDALVAALQAEGERLAEQHRSNRERLKVQQARMVEIHSTLNALGQMEAKQRQYTALVGSLETRQKHLTAEREAWEKNGAQRLESVQRQLAGEAFAGEARTCLAEIDARLQALGYDEQAHESARRREQQGRAAEEDFRLLTNARAALVPLEREIRDLEKQVQTQMAEVQTQQQAWESATQKLQTAQEQAPDVDSARRKVSRLRERENRLHMEIGGARQKVNVLASLEADRLQLLSRQDDLALTLSRYNRLEQAFGKKGAPALLIEAALPEIEMHANDILDRLSEGQMYVQFVTQKAYKTKRTDFQETLDIQIRDANGERPYEMFSGGEAFRVDFAIRLALSRVLAARAGARLQTLVIDEGFGSQDAQGRQRLVEAINLIKDDFEKILIITHIESLKDAFPTRIEVTKTPAGSRIQVL